MDRVIATRNGELPEREAAAAGDELIAASELADEHRITHETSLDQADQRHAAPLLVHAVIGDENLALLWQTRGSEKADALDHRGDRALHVGRATTIDQVTFSPDRSVRRGDRVEMGMPLDRRTRRGAAKPANDARRAGELLIEDDVLRARLHERCPD